MEQKGYKILGPFKQVLTMKGLSKNGPISDDELEIVENISILLKGDKIERLEKHALLKIEYPNASVTDLNEDHILLPGFIDSHTHICYAGSRARDFALRNSGSSYLEIAKKGGGIWDTVQKTRAASKDFLIDKITERAKQHNENGITTIEVKSGYGLNFDNEFKMLEAIKSASKDLDFDLVPTCLAPHIKPKDFAGSHLEYVNEIVELLLPEIKKRKLCNRLDAFIEEEAFDQKSILPYLDYAKEHNFDITLHVDQFTSGGSYLAGDYKILSADHLEASTEREIDYLIKNGVICTVLPGATLGLGCPFAPARLILDRGGSLAIASDWNPGSGPIGDLITSASILATFQKLSNAEVLAGITFRAANALRLFDRGIISPNKKADLVSYKTNNYNEILYHQGQLKPSLIVNSGKIMQL